MKPILNQNNFIPKSLVYDELDFLFDMKPVQREIYKNLFDLAIKVDKPPQKY